MISAVFLLSLILVASGMLNRDFPSGSDEDSWDMFRGSSRHSGRSNISLSGNNGKLVMLFTAGGPIYSSPVISPDDNIVFGSLDGNVYSVHPNGTLYWKFETEGPVYSSPCISENGSTMIGSMDGNIYSIDSMGRLNWKYGTEGGIRSSPVVDDVGNVYFGSRDDHLYCLDRNGGFVFKYRTGADVDSSPAFAEDGRILFGSDDGSLYCLDIGGDLIWTYETGSWVYSSPSIDSDGSAIFGSDDGHVYRILQNGSIDWRYFAGNDVYSSPSLKEDGVILAGTDNDTIIALDRNGSRIWSFIMDEDVFSSTLLDSDGRLVAADRSGRLVCLDVKGSLIWERELGSPVTSSSPGIGNEGTIYVGTSDGMLIGIGRDMTSPNFVSDNSDMEASTGDPFDLSVRVVDDNFIENVEVSVEFWFGTGDHSYIEMNRTGEDFHCEIGIPLNSIDHMFYRFIATDLEGQRSFFPGPFSSQMVPVIDDEDPEILDFSIGNCTTGDPVEIDLRTRDNIEVQNAVLHWTHGDFSGFGSFGERLTNGTFRTKLLLTPCLEPLEYWIEIFDTSSNSVHTPKTTALVFDNDPPWFEDNSSLTWLSGHPFIFDVLARDNSGYLSLEAQHSMGPENIDLLPTGNNSYFGEIEHPQKPIDSFQYRLIAEDEIGNNIVGNWTDVSILNGSGPRITLLSGEPGPTTGDIYEVRAEIEDVSTDSVFLEYWFGSGPKASKAMEQTGSVFSLLIDVPLNCTDSLFVKINGTNPDGFSNTLGPIDLPITDNDSPTFTSISVPSECGTGNDLVINVTAEDNIGVQGLNIGYSFGESPNENISLDGTGPFSFCIYVSSSFTGKMDLTLTLEDDFGNSETSEIFQVRVTDDDPPEILSDLTPRKIAAGDELEFKVEVSDNIGVESVLAIFRLENGTEEKLELPESEYYSAEITAPEEGGNLFYRIRAADSEGNFMETEERTILIESEDERADRQTSPLYFIAGSFVVVLLAIIIVIIWSFNRGVKGGEE